MSLSIGELTGYLNLEDQGFSSGLDRADSKLGLLGGKGGKVFGALAIGTAVVGAVGGAFYALGSSVDGAYDTIRVGTGATGEDLKGLRDDFKQVVRDVPTDFDTAGAAIADLNTMTGATGETLQDLTGSVLEASRMLGEDGAANAKTFGKALNQWQIPAEQGTQVMDELFKVTQDYGMGLDETMGHLNKYGSVLQNAGFSMGESAGLMGQLEKAGLSVSRVMPGLNSAFRGWAGEGKNSREELAKVMAQMKGAEDSSKALTIATETFGAEGAQRLTTAVRTGAMSLEDLEGALDDASGSVDSAARDTASFGEAWTRVKNNVLMAVEPAATALFTAIGDGMTTVADNVGPVLDTLTGLWESITSGTGESGEAFDQAREVIAEALETIRTVVADVTAGVMAVWDRWGSTIMALAGNTFGTVTKVISAALKIVRGVIKTVTSLIRGDWSGAWDGIRMILSGAWDAITALVSGAATQVRILLAAAWDAIKSAAADAWQALVNIIRGKVDDAVDRVRGIKSSITGFFAGAGTWLADAGKRLIGGLIDGIKAMIPDVGGAMSAIGNKVKGFLPGSPVREGPLTAWNNGGAGKRLVGMLADGLGETSPVDRAMQALTSAMSLPDLQPAMAAVGANAMAGQQRPSVVRERIVERQGPLIGSVEQRPDEDAGELAERLWFITRSRG